MKLRRSKLLKAFVVTIGIVGGLIVLILAASMLIYPREYVYRMLTWGEIDAYDYLNNFPSRQLYAAPIPFHFDKSLDEDRIGALFEVHAGVDDWDAFLETNGTWAFIVIQDGSILYEKYYNGRERDSLATSFSVAKSFTSALIGIAIEDGFVDSADDPITKYLPELAKRDPRFNAITIRHLLLMASGLDFREDRWAILNGDGPLTTYYPDQRKIALENTRILDSPGEYFLYNKYHPQLLGMIIERTSGMSVTEYLQDRIWSPIGMEFDGSWSIDSASSDFEKMEAGINARAIDFAKFGQLYLNKGEWDGIQVIPERWVMESTEPLIPANYSDYYPDSFLLMPGQGYYKFMWWGMKRDEGRYDFAAEGDHGQFIYVSPHKSLVIVRNGEEWGIPGTKWLDTFYRFSSEL